MNNPVTSSDITLLNTLAACANMTADEVFKDFEIMANVIRQIKRCLFRQIKTGLSELLTMG